MISRGQTGRTSTQPAQLSGRFFLRANLRSNPNPNGGGSVAGSVAGGGNLARGGSVAGGGCLARGGSVAGGGNLARDGSVAGGRLRSNSSQQSGYSTSESTRFVSYFSENKEQLVSTIEFRGSYRFLSGIKGSRLWSN